MWNAHAEPALALDARDAGPLDPSRRGARAARARLRSETASVGNALPADHSGSIAPDPALLANLERPIEQPRILLAEDDEAYRNLIGSALRRDGFEVIEARDGTELFAIIEAAVYLGGRQQPPLSLVLSDVRMPGFSGLDILWILSAGVWEVPVILLSAFVDPAMRTEALSLGARSVLDKPIDVDELRKIVKEVLGS